MFFMLFLGSVRTEYVKSTLRSVARIVGGRYEAFVKFYSQGCGDCFEWAAPFSEASMIFPEVRFGGVNCLEQDLFEQGGSANIPRSAFSRRAITRESPTTGCTWSMPFVSLSRRRRM
jgi:hypothetical protein